MFIPCESERERCKFYSLCEEFIYVFIKTHLYSVDIISSQAISQMCTVVILLYENKHSTIYYITQMKYIIQIENHSF